MHHADCQPYHCPEGTVYGTLLNFQRERALWATRSEAAPYLASAQAPVLYIKTANTFNPSGGAVALPHGVPALEVGASLGLIMGDDAQAHALAVFNDWSVPHDSYYRPPVRFKNGDGWLGVGAQRLALNDWSQLSDLSLQVVINDRVVQTVDWSGLYRDPARLVEDVTAFTAWRTGDVLLLGLDCLPDGARPLAHAGDRVRITAAHGLWVEHTVVGEVA
jgi:5-oxopent-3-ene-1,2,5-tricarboxylate decarboxylase / 2-hydroxyhepta-2,4-diene-1,7-dioate isomerase